MRRLRKRADDCNPDFGSHIYSRTSRRKIHSHSHTSEKPDTS